MSPFLGELVGTALLVTLGDGVVANVLLNKTKGNGGGWIVVTFGWAMAVYTVVICVAGRHYLCLVLWFVLKDDVLCSLRGFGLPVCR